MYNPIELPSLDEIAEIEQARTKAIESLEMFDDDTLVKCQGKCGSLYPVIHKSNLTSDRDKINQLCRRIEYMKNHLPASQKSK
jgi:hypothetical protein